ncbi:hypothetical protein Q3G72_007795 [Acer saccharum]|nr:hypothetical protein Q3G72_007795 [Acer saccharum]
MRFIKALSFYDYAKRARLSLVGVDIGKTQSGTCLRGVVRFHFGFPYDQRFLVEEMVDMMNDLSLSTTISTIRNMRFLKALSLYDYAKRAGLPLLRVDIGKTQSGVYVAYPTSGVIVPARLSIYGPIYSVRHNLIDEAADSIEFSTALNRLVEKYRAVEFHFGFSYDQRFLNDPELVEEIVDKMKDLSL